MYKACVQRVMVYDSEAWPMRSEDMQRLVERRGCWLDGCVR